MQLSQEFIEAPYESEKFLEQQLGKTEAEKLVEERDDLKKQLSALKEQLLAMNSGNGKLEKVCSFWTIKLQFILCLNFSFVRVDFIGRSLNRKESRIFILHYS